MNRMPGAVAEMAMDGATGPGAEGARRATGASGPVAPSGATDPDPEVPAKIQRRRFTAAYRLRIVRQADACKKLRRGGGAAAPRRPVRVASDHVASPARAG